CKPTLASDNIRDFPPPDLIFICVKSYDLNSLLEGLKLKILNHTVIIPLMNGIDIHERIRKIIKNGIVLPSCVYVGSHIEQPGMVIQTGNPGFFYFGPDPQHPEFNPQELLSLFKMLEINGHWTKDVETEIWKKYLLVASFALVTAHTGQTLGGVINDPKSLEILKKIMKEILIIGQKKGLILPDSLIENIIEFCKDYPDVKTSYQRDVEKGKKNEGELFGGTIIRLGKEMGIPTPMTEKIYSYRLKNKLSA
ncbi:MAG: ketopantoate reductase family protein, partial [Promethearchaeota archaeon]